MSVVSKETIIKIFQFKELSFQINVEKWPPNTVLESCGINNARFLNYISSFFNNVHERVN